MVNTIRFYNALILNLIYVYMIIVLTFYSIFYSIKYTLFAMHILLLYLTYLAFKILTIN